MRYSRTSRISEEIKKIVSSLIMNELKDPRISKLTSITHVETTGDLRYANIYVSTFGKDSDNHDETIEALNNAKGFIRKELGKHLKLRYTPEPIFKSDDSIKQGVYMSKLIENVNKLAPSKQEVEDND
ncbi:30S ribosome-binding factor RbfA [Paramaledivibacter caminithermalis]|uniref:Ribosome-binding factor A n=1 Tax=Paramaledivibacter caminithermalis (strain DSM 15212 / CIP 107654 / DViRD3) TaxID=1121301 RepID=A0A1M6N5J2_PARC5|nr:30S ribosome-binding factor RbfA [Paramaledivibacter caminithermalis]SHJ90893.1 ribosome-binding factor A [Paramaledivibacter caminithermalis DSM 15212]